MSETIIKVENLSKKYTVGHNHGKGKDGLRDVITSGAKNIGKKLLVPFGFLEHRTYPPEEEFWALKDVSFEVKQGERIGIIGRNGAGKSTLLKLLSQITEPTTGRIEIGGRVASLLEVGTGFHPELTGRENVYLNGVILGMTRAEIKNKFDEIVAFAEVEKFLDMPVKRYSSGMYVRLAFSVAAHLEPEILILDEVLAVGDTIFQKKCLDKMLEVSRQGKTILFVSHNFSAVKALCQNALLLQNGMLYYKGSTQDTIGCYIGEGGLSGQEIDLTKHARGHAKELIFEKITFVSYPIIFGSPIKFKLKLKSTGTNNYFPDIDFGIAVKDRNNNTLIHCSNRFINKSFDHASDDTEYLFEIENIMKPDIYYLTLFLRNKEVIQDCLSSIVKIEIEDGNPYMFPDTKQIQGLFLPLFNVTATRI